MASMMSVISLFVLLLITYSYAKPVRVQYSLSTPTYQFATNGRMVQNGSSSYMGSMDSETSTGALNIHHQRSLAELSSEETTTLGGMTVTPRSIGESNSEETTTLGGMTVTPRSIGESNSQEDTTWGGMTVTPRSVGESNSQEATTWGGMTVTPRSIGESNSQESTTPYGVPVSPRSVGESNSGETWSSTPFGQQQNFYQFPSTTLESKIAFNQRAIPHSGEVEDFSSTTQSYGQGQVGTNQNVQSSSSATKFHQNSGWTSNGQSGSQFVRRDPPPPPRPFAPSQDSSFEKRSYSGIDDVQNSQGNVASPVSSQQSSANWPTNTNSVGSFPSKNVGGLNSPQGNMIQRI